MRTSAPLQTFEKLDGILSLQCFLMFRFFAQLWFCLIWILRFSKENSDNPISNYRNVQNVINFPEILFHLFPEDTVLEGFTRLRRGEVELLRDTTRDVDHTLAHFASIEHLEAAVELSVGFLE